MAKLPRGLFSWFSKYIFLKSIGLMVKKKETITKIPSRNESIKTAGHYESLKINLLKAGKLSLKQSN